LQIGQRLRIPIPSSGVASRQEVAATSPGATRTYYTVRSGDNLGQIAEDHGVGLSQLRSWNGLRPGSSYIRVGQKLVVYPPATTRSPTLAVQRPANMAGMARYAYTVRPGDTLGQIAEAHDVGLSKLRSWNGIRTSSNYIRVGQRLVIWKQAG
jgi:membrane-bound lytic murein transglycosylase D